MNRLRHILLLSIFIVSFLITSAIHNNAAAESGPDNSIDESNNTLLTYIPIAANTPTLTNCRYGVNNRPGLPGNQWMTAIGVGHYINFLAFPHGQPVPDSVELLFQVRMQQEQKDGEYLPSVIFMPPLTMEEDGLGPVVLANPGRLWMVGNEPDVANVSQDNVLPTTYAWAYHEVYHFIKELDPTAHIANGGLSMMTPGRRQYLNIVWNTYLDAFGEEMPVDVWNMHLYILSEIRQSDGGNSDGKIALGTDPALAIKDPNGPPETECLKDDVYCRAEHDDIDIFKEQIGMMRSWMKNHGQQNKPLILSEYSQLYPFVEYDDLVNPSRCYLMDEFGQCFTPNRVSTYMQQTMDYLETAKDPDLGYAADDYRLVQQHAWYSMWTGQEMTGAASNLLVEDYYIYAPDSPSALSQVGRTYSDRVFSREQTIDLVAGEAADVETQAEQPGGTADVELSVGFLNNGSGLIVKPFKVTFYEDAALTQVIGETTVRPGQTGLINGCAWDRITDWASVTWDDVPVGIYNYWVEVDSQNDIGGETDGGNNVASGQVTVTP
jgi:hypothetical protein